MIAQAALKQVFIGCGAMALLLGCGGGESKTGEDEMVDIFKDGAMQRIQLKKLTPEAPNTVGPIKSPAQLPNADAIVGWYDKGHNYNKEKMGGKGLVPIDVDPNLLKGEAVDDKLYIVREGSDVAEIVAPDMIQGFIANPGLLASDAIVGWYDKGHNFNKEKMGGKQLTEQLIDPKLHKGAALPQLDGYKYGKEKGAKELGDVKIDPSAQKGTVLPPQDVGQVSPGVIQQVDGYKEGKGKEKGAKELGEVTINPARQKGAAVQH